ncbi:MAG TPA: hypothetical protein VGM16_11660 [Gammaproteobacteria bacterium]|jgi:hypothetical protein
MSENDVNQNQQNAGSDQQDADKGLQAAANQDKQTQRAGSQQSHSGSSSDDDSSESTERSTRSSDDDSASDRSSSGSNQPRGAAVDKEAQRKGGQHSHGGTGNNR